MMVLAKAEKVWWDDNEMVLDEHRMAARRDGKSAPAGDNINCSPVANIVIKKSVQLFDTMLRV